MEGLQELNPKKDTASNPMIMFLVLNTSGLTIIPVSIMVYRTQMEAAQPTDVFIPILLATFASTLTGIIVTSLYQRINLLNRVVVLALGGACLAVAGIVYGFSRLDKEEMNLWSTTIANVLLFCIIMLHCCRSSGNALTCTMPLSKEQKTVLPQPYVSFPI